MCNGIGGVESAHSANSACIFTAHLAEMQFPGRYREKDRPDSTGSGQRSGAHHAPCTHVNTAYIFIHNARRERVRERDVERREGERVEERMRGGRNKSEGKNTRERTIRA